MPAATSSIGSAGLVDQLGQFIQQQSLKPGDRLPSIRDLADHFGVKAGLVRDALLDAQGRGLVKVLPRAGAFVETAAETHQPVTSAERLGQRLRELLTAENQNLFHLLDARETLELALIAQAARKREIEDLFSLRDILEQMAGIPSRKRGKNYVRLDIEFHLEIARLSGNAVMAAMLCAVMEQLAPHLKELRWSPKRHSDTEESHARIYSALVAGDVALAQAETRNHLQHAYKSLLDRIRHPPNGG
ncbi:MAG: FadR family transcriptional regulator [Fuerstiella sp.]|nr:FadR family transcriptional regulator [Fuerstiella sp.]MCP4513430.1 FadR family transcriptional regulator [Fuerstiella sp.]